MMQTKIIFLLFFILLLITGSLESSAAEFNFINGDGPGEGLNDPTPVAPVGGNPGTTLGAQRLAVLQKAGAIWGAFLVSPVPIRVDVGFDILGTNVLAGASPVSQQQNFSNAPRLNTWYPIALANSLAGIDLEVGLNDISITASSNGSFYYGLDSITPAGKSNFVDVLLHELGHGLGFISFINGSTGNLFLGQIDVFSAYIFDKQFNQSWENFTSIQRVASAINDPNLTWAGPFTTAGFPQKLSPQVGISGYKLVANFPGPISQVIPFEIADFGPVIPNTGISGELVTSNPNDACGVITNSAQMLGKIAFIRRGACNFDDKVYKAQQAGAIAVVIANNVETGLITPTGDSVVDGVPVIISIPMVFVSKADGDAFLAAMPGIQVFLTPILSQFFGAYDSQQRLHAPAILSTGSSVSHWSTDASPNLLMEPIINPNLDRKLDLTLTQMKDIGWTVIDIPFPHLTYDSWKSLVFTISDTMVSLSDDPDADGVSNLEEYFFGNNPKKSDMARLPFFQFSSGQADLVFTRSKLTTDLTYVLEKSGNLTLFQPAVNGIDYQNVSIQSIGTDAEKVTLRVLNPTSKLFLRLRIQQNP